MGVGRAVLAITLFLLFIPILIVILAATGILPSTPTQATNTVKVTNEPAGIDYWGPPTTALAGYYCVRNASIASTGWLVNNQGQQTNILECTPGQCTYQPNPTAYRPPGYMIQLNVMLSNGFYLQNMYGGSWQGSTIFLEEEVFTTNESPWQSLSLNTGPPAQPCGWLVISIKNGMAYFGYSSNGEDVDWYYTYPVGNALITNGSFTNLVIAGPGNAAGVNFTRLYAVLALWYWNGTTWVPAQTYVVGSNPGTLEFVTNAWVYNYNNTAVITWPKPVNESVPVPTPGFKP